MRNCGRCHACGTALLVVRDREEWCPTCKTHRRYWSHGWGWDAGEGPACPPAPEALCCADDDDPGFSDSVL